MRPWLGRRRLFSIEGEGNRRGREVVPLQTMNTITSNLGTVVAVRGSVVDVQAEQEGFLAHGKDLNVQPPTFNIQHPMTNDE